MTVISPDALYLVMAAALCYALFVVVLLIALVVFLMTRAKIRKEIGLYKTHIKYHPDPPEKIYVIK
jgi:hypothetical protein